MNVLREIRARGSLVPLAAAAVGLILIALAVATAVWSHNKDRDTEARALQRAVRSEQQELTNYFERSRSLIKLLAQNPTFKSFYELPGSRMQKLRQGGPVVDDVNAALAQMEELFPGRIGEACFIDDGGAENGRSVHGEVAPLSEFSTEEDRAPFFEPSFALSPGQVFQARPYLSPDTDDWVIANATPVSLPRGAGEAIVHFEIPIESFRREAAALSPEFEITVVNAARDEIVFESAHPIVGTSTSSAKSHEHPDAPFPSIATHPSLPPLNGAPESGVFEAGGRVGAYEPVDTGSNNANEWTVIATIRTPAPGLAASIGLTEIGLLIGGILLIGTAFFVQRSSRLAAEESDRMKTDLLGLVSHELRTPLTSIVGYTELLADLESERMSEQGKGFVEVIGRNAHRELRLVGDLLVLQQIDGGKFTIHPEPIDIGSVVDVAVESARAKAEEEDLELTSEIGPGAVILGDRDRIGQVLDNLLSNAFKYTPGGGSVEVRLAVEADTVVIEVADTGLGIPEHDLERLFGRLFRASNATELHIPGIGLGLSIVKAIVEAHGGTVSVTSRIDEGTTFRVELPVTSAPAPQAKIPLGAL